LRSGLVTIFSGVTILGGSTYPRRPLPHDTVGRFDCATAVVSLMAMLIHTLAGLHPSQRSMPEREPT